MTHTLHTTSFGDSLIVTGQWDYENKSELRLYLESPELQTLMKKIGQDVIIVLGGDGTMLAAIDTFRERDIPFLGINFGTIGYLMHPREKLIDAQIFETTNHPLLKAQIHTHGEMTNHYAFGDVYVKPQVGGNTCNYDTEICLPQGPKVAALSVLGDGIILSTPAGSTGYAANCGADILPMESSQFLVTHIASPRSRSLHPIQIANESTVTITPHQLERRPILVYTDGRIIHASGSESDLNIMVRKATKSVRLLIADSHRDTWYTRSLRGDGYTTS